ncbi:MAG TPA: sugar ABC transporter ATP-binding protein, partial [Chloroflexota bacterium]
VHAVVGENGAGKSTLMKVLSGVLQRDEGEIRLDGRPVEIVGPRVARELGISTIYQEFSLVPHLSVAENIYLGRQPGRWGLVAWRQMERDAAALLDALGVPLDPRAPVGSLSVAQQQMVEVARALSTRARILVMDEPTSALTDHEVDLLFALIRRIKAEGLAVIFISHRLEEVFEIADRITVLRDGKRVASLDARETSPSAIVRLMVGRAPADFFHKTTARVGDVVLDVRGLSRAVTREGVTRTVLDDVSLTVRRGEIVGIAGLIGAGRTELARAIVGADPIDEGEVWIDGQRARIRSPRDAIRLGIGFVPENRKEQALILGMAVRENISLARLGLDGYGPVDYGHERSLAERLAAALKIRTPTVEQPVVNLSGGNQQKVVIARWLALSPKVLILDEPTRGIDVGAKAEIHALIGQLAAQGVGILMISSELPEILGMSDRVLVMSEGRITGAFTRGEATQEKIMACATQRHHAVDQRAEGKERASDGGAR